MSKVIRVLVFTILFYSCSSSTMESWINVSNNFLDVVDKAYEQYQKISDPGDRSAFDIKEYEAGDMISEKDQKTLLDLFNKVGYADATCGLYVCKDNESIPCVKKDKNCICTCAIRK